jgi:phosphate transport system substrate-binding protein
MKAPLCYETSQRKKISLLRSISVILLGAFLAGCNASKTETTITMRGSNTIGEELAPRLIEEYKKDHPNLVFDTEFKATPYGIGALMAGRCDIAAASRTVTTNEQRMARDRNIEFNDYLIGSYSVAIVVNPGSPLGDLTKDQVRDIFTGAIQNWKDVGGPDAPIHLYVRDPISGTHIGFQELAMEKKPYGPGIKTFTNYEGIVQAVASDPAGIGYSSINGTKKANVKTLSIGGVAPTAASVNRGQYTYARPLRLYTDKVKETPETHEFVQFIVSSKGQQILTDMGYVPRP